MKNQIILWMTIAATTVFSSCDYLNVDNYFSDELKLDSVFHSKMYLEAYLWGTASMFPDEGAMFRYNTSPGPMGCDEAFTVMGTQYNYNGINYVLGLVNASGGANELDQWNNMYRIIRKCNTLFQRNTEAKDLTPTERVELLAYTRFVRAYAYYRLLIEIGPPIIVGDDVVENNEALPYYDRARSTYDEAVEYICAEFEEAAKYLPLEQPIMNFGRPTKGAAYGLIARIRILHASPLYNGGSAARQAFGTWKRKTDGVYYVAQQPDPKRWAVAAAACKRVMDMDKYKLHTVPSSSGTNTKPMPKDTAEVEAIDPDFYKTWPEGAAGIDHFKSYSDIFTGEAVAVSNPEYVWARRSPRVSEETQQVFPNTSGGWSGIAINQKIIDNYYMFDGRDKGNPSQAYPYSETGYTGTSETFSGYTLNGGIYNMYANREMRFYACIGFSGCFWPMSSNTNAGMYNVYISYEFNGNCGRNSSTDPLNYPPTGYVIKKFIHPNDGWSDGGRRMDKTYAMIRYADILLYYAEALNNLDQSYTVDIGGTSYTVERNVDAVRAAFNQVRHRAGLPGMSTSEAANPATVQNLIERERMSEFLCEGQRYYDVRRWGLYEETERVPFMGMNVDGDRDAYFRRVIPNTSRIGQRVVDKKMILLPLPLSEVRRLPSCDQNPGWED